MYISAMNFARGAGLTYVHRPFREISHADRPMHEWARTWESMFAFGLGEVQWAPTMGRMLTYNPYEYAGWLGGPRGKYRHAEHAVSASRDRGLVIAMHVRRGDVSRTRNTFLFTDLSAVLRTCETVREILTRRRVAHRFRIFSEGRPEDFAELSVLNPEWMVDVDDDVSRFGGG